MKVEPFTTPNFAKSESGLQIDIGMLTKSEFKQYCNSFLKKLKVNYNIRRKSWNNKLKDTSADDCEIKGEKNEI